MFGSHKIDVEKRKGEKGEKKKGTDMTQGIFTTGSKTNCFLICSSLSWTFDPNFQKCHYSWVNWWGSFLSLLVSEASRRAPSPPCPERSSFLTWSPWGISRMFVTQGHTQKNCFFYLKIFLTGKLSLISLFAIMVLFPNKQVNCDTWYYGTEKRNVYLPSFPHNSIDQSRNF